MEVPGCLARSHSVGDRQAVTFRRKLLAVFAITVLLSVGFVTSIVSYVTRRAFERADEEQTRALIGQFRREFNRTGEEVARRIESVANSDAATRIALAASRGSPDYGAHLNEAKALAENQQLDFLEFVDGEGTILSSAQWPAKFGYKELSLPAKPRQEAFLKQEELPEGAALGLVALRQLEIGEKPVYVTGGRRLTKDFLASLELPTGMRVMLYENIGNGFSPKLLIDPSNSARPERVSALIEQVQQQHQEANAVIHWSTNPGDDESFQAIPLPAADDSIAGILLLGNSRRPYMELRQHIRSAALLAAGAGIVLAVLFSGWAASRVTRPVEQLAEAAREITAGKWNTQVPIASADELGALAESFNRMTTELLAQKEQLVQSERVAAWRELARRLAHELKNPLFPLQLTVENLIRAREQNPDQFDEVFRESASTLLAEISNLKTIISRFSEFSKMPQPRFQAVDLTELVHNVARLFQAQLGSQSRPAIECRVELGKGMAPLAADPELLHRALSNLVLNAMDAMPKGGVLTLRTSQHGDRACIEVSDTGAGLNDAECQRLFTPYYTSKPNGTGLGLAIVQSVVSDHGGSISVRSEPGRGTSFRIELPANSDKIPIAEAARNASGAEI
jgi:two-component system, NtrC family, nitrogen regulation sensor histidine kinase NtrY